MALEGPASALQRAKRVRWQLAVFAAGARYQSSQLTLLNLLAKVSGIVTTLLVM